MTDSPEETPAMFHPAILMNDIERFWNTDRELAAEGLPRTQEIRERRRLERCVNAWRGFVLFREELDDECVATLDDLMEKIGTWLDAADDKLNFQLVTPRSRGTRAKSTSVRIEQERTELLWTYYEQQVKQKTFKTKKDFIEAYANQHAKSYSWVEKGLRRWKPKMETRFRELEKSRNE